MRSTTGRDARPAPAPARTPVPAVAGALLCVAAVALVAGLDAVQAARAWPVPVIGLLDEPAHLATAAVFLVAVLPSRARAALPWAVAGAVLIDLDHVPFYLWGALTAGDAGRPLTHSLATVAVLALAAVVGRGRVRAALLGLALGVLLHLVRDLGTGPGVPLWWPVSDDSVVLPYGIYLGTTTAVAGAAALRLLHKRAEEAPAPGTEKPDPALPR